ncbi:hypothetical protein EMIHUDRAFT_454231 [Emiliania huxleyi CCMP1516]|uniref:Uncharacterized protein n=2 Tax=Emiliania huxleyi TaxID=2903 RepID=A0A0D3KXS7_EMIH1|nr:hypothetical protein EMIHUDRAFT_454231 [Emiliania huxleyi CCMP1516]EOD40562.1 hypothetical protein EMIHUDRAFT_454231 [Emiliania huxleyi CCMP1516]|eukprot:XP_005792991.1 hypothetical protein EMIHUDRAFT_454231 [Emiliania huxleyi CCMP1516]
MAGDSLAGSLGEVPAKDVAVIAKAASEEAAKWLKRNNVEAGAGTLAYAGTLLKISTSSDQRTRTGIFILIASGGTVYIEPLSSKVIASATDALIKLYLQSDTPERRTSMSEYVELSFADKIKLPQQFGGPATTVTRTLVDDTELNRFVSVSHVDKRALAAINNAVYQVLLDKIVVGERPREEIMRLVDGLPGLATATTLLVALYSKVSGADPDLQERAYEELARTPLLAGGFGREAEQERRTVTRHHERRHVLISAPAAIIVFDTGATEHIHPNQADLINTRPSNVTFIGLSGEAADASVVGDLPLVLTDAAEREFPFLLRGESTMPPKKSRGSSTLSTKQKQVASKLEVLASLPTKHGGLSLPWYHLTGIYGEGSFFEDVEGGDLQLVIVRSEISDAAEHNRAAQRFKIFLEAACLGWDENRRRWRDSTGPAPWHELTFEREKAVEGRLVADAAVWALREVAAGRIHTVQGPRAREPQFRSPHFLYDLTAESLRAAWLPLDVEGVCAVVHSWARKVSWKKLDERMLRCSPLGEHLPSQAQLFHWLLTQAVGRMPVTYADEAYVALATGSAPAAPTGSPASGARFEAEAERKARLESMAREKPLALLWLAFLRGATRCLLTPEHACHAAFADDDTYPLWRYTNDVLRALPAEMHLVAACADSPEWANVSQTYAEWPAEATLSLADAARSLALHAQWGPSKGAAPRKAAGLLTMSDLGWRWRDDNNIFSLREPPPLLPEPEADVLVRLARPADGAATALPEVKGRLKRALAHVDACVALFDHALHLHLYRWEYDSKSKCDLCFFLDQRDRIGLPNLPVCGSLLRGGHRLHLAMPQKHRFEDDGPSAAGQVLLEGSAAQRQELLAALRQIAAERGEGALEGIVGDDLRIAMPHSSQQLVNECMLALLALTKSARVSKPAQLAAALHLCRLPASEAEVAARLDAPKATPALLDAGLRRRRWQQRRCFFLVRQHGPSSHVLCRLPRELFEHVVSFA